MTIVSISMQVLASYRCLLGHYMKLDCLALQHHHIYLVVVVDQKAQPWHHTDFLPFLDAQHHSVFCNLGWTTWRSLCIIILARLRFRFRFRLWFWLRLQFRWKWRFMLCQVTTSEVFGSHFKFIMTFTYSTSTLKITCLLEASAYFLLAFSSSTCFLASYNLG